MTMLLLLPLVSTLFDGADSAGYHEVVQGRRNSAWGLLPRYYCQSDDDNQAAYQAPWLGYDIAVRCCSGSGHSVEGHTPDCGAHPATYADAVRVCTVDNPYRLCTRQEILAQVTAGTGCAYNGAYIWVSDECDDPLPTPQPTPQPTGTGCDAASFTAQGCTEGENCFLEALNRWSGSCCTSDFQCLEGEGDCDSDNDCAGDLVCGNNNCGADSPFQDTHDCCTPVAEGPTGCDAKSFNESPKCTEGENCTLQNGRRSGSCCTSEFQCLEGEGDCDSDSDCAPGLVCGTNNCGHPFQDTHDCCERSDVSVSASVAVSAGAAVVAEDGSGADKANPDGNTTAIWTEAVFGAVISAVLISAAILLVLFMAKRRKSAGKKAVTEMCDAVHVPELSPTDCAEMDTVEVVTAKDTGDAEEVPSSELAEAMTTADAGNTESV